MVILTERHITHRHLGLALLCSALVPGLGVLYARRTVDNYMRTVLYFMLFLALLSNAIHGSRAAIFLLTLQWIMVLSLTWTEVEENNREWENNG